MSRDIKQLANIGNGKVRAGPCTLRASRPGFWAEMRLSLAQLTPLEEGPGWV